MNYREVAEQIFRAGVEGVLPGRLIHNTISLTNNWLSIGKYKFNLDSAGSIYVIGAGKASALMGAGVERIIGDRITEGYIVVKYDHSCPLEKIKVSEAGHPVPDPAGFAATRKILELSVKATKNDLVLCLLSGGGSSLLSDFPAGSSPEEIMVVNNLLVKSGCPISEINTIRKHISNVKGGQLARTVCPGTLVSLILSDVAGDPLDVIASGPTVPDPSTFQQSLEILKRYNLTELFPAAITDYLVKGSRGMIPETPKPGDHVFDKTFNILIGSNRLALEAAQLKATQFNLNTEIISDRVEGDVFEVSRYLIETALEYQLDNKVKKPVCLLFGGEPTVKVSGEGTGAGGRNQHLALYCSGLLKNQRGITILSGGTDGNDGPTSAAGAVVDCNTFKDAVARNIDPDQFLREFDSFNFFRKAGGHIITGPTMTNVMDIIAVIID